MRRVAWLIPLWFAAGCTSTVIFGMGSGGSTGTPASASASSAAASSTGTPGKTGTTSGAATSTGAGTSSGSGTSKGGSSTGRAPECGPFEASCEVGADCCSDTCSDAGSCACSVSYSCSADSDCCYGASCEVSTPPPPYPAVHYCCAGLGQPCNDGNGGSFCCAGKECNKGICTCDGLDSYSYPCLTDGDCCTGHCLSYLRHGWAYESAACFEAPGEPCDAGDECAIGTCVNGTCAGCNSAYALCRTAADCCGGLSCAPLYGSPLYSPPFDAGGLCCVPSGGACGDGGACCSGLCMNGACQCAEPTQNCENDLGCCSGICQELSPDPPVCCQPDGQTCYAPAECCSGNCTPDQKCACAPTGHACGGGYPVLGAAACCSGECGDAGACL